MINREKLQKIASHSSSFDQTRTEINYCLKNGQWIHSRYDPQKESMRLMKEILSLDPKTTLLIFLGCGLGYHVELAEKAGFTQVLLLERNPEIYNIFSQIYELPASYFLFGPKSKDLELDFYLSTKELQGFKKIKTVILRGAYQSDLYQHFEKRLEHLFKVKLGDFTTRLKFEEIWFIHILKNLPSLFHSANVLRLFQVFSDVPVVVISAGPSLRDSLDQIKKWKKQAFLIAVDTALLVLYEAGIQPDFVYSLDSQIYNLNDFSMLPREYLKDIVLIYDLVVHPALPAHYAGPKIAANTAHLDFDQNGNPFVIKNELVSWLEMSLGRVGDVETGGSVATSAFHFAYLMGGHPLVLCGQDLAYTHYQSHSVSTPHYYGLSKLTHRLKPLESVFMDIMQKRKPMEKEGIEGNVLTDFMLNNFRGWFQESAKNLTHYVGQSISLINATASGIKIDYFKQERFPNLSHYKKPARSQLKALLETPFIESNKRNGLESLLTNLLSFINVLETKKNIFENIENSKYTFLIRYFMKEQMVLNRYGKVDQNILERKLSRLKKNLKGVIDDIKTSH